VTSSPLPPYTPDSVSLYLVRHASALDRSRWRLDDLERPLDRRGAAQAQAITAYFSGHDLRGVWSSRAVRCVDTVAGTADAHGLPVELRAELTEGASPNALLELLREETSADGDLVMCSHGDLIPEVLSRLLRQGMSVLGARGCEKASVWELETRGRDITKGRYTAAP
jgi:phosphohistidine phosphatase SixA